MTQMMKCALALVPTLILTGCAMSKQTYLPDGRKGHSIDCSGAALNWGYCETKAGSICKEAGYEVISASQDGTPFSYSSGAPQTRMSGYMISRTMLVACK